MVAPFKIAPYVLVAPLSWLLAGSAKFVINSLKHRRLAWRQIGYGGLPSTHTAIVSASGWLVGMREGWNSPIFSVALTLTLIVVIDATSLRRHIGKQATALNLLLESMPDAVRLRGRMGHRWIDILAGAAVGWLAAYFLSGTF